MKPSCGPDRTGRDSAGSKQLAEGSQQLATNEATDNSPLTTDNRKSCSSVWLEHYTDNVGVSSSNLLGTTAQRCCSIQQQVASSKKNKKVLIPDTEYLILTINWGISSAGQSTCLARRGSTVRIRYSPRLSKKQKAKSTKPLTAFSFRLLALSLKTFFDILEEVKKKRRQQQGGTESVSGSKYQVAGQGS